MLNVFNVIENCLIEVQTCFTVSLPPTFIGIQGLIDFIALKVPQ